MPKFIIPLLVPVFVMQKTRGFSKSLQFAYFEHLKMIETVVGASKHVRENAQQELHGIYKEREQMAGIGC